ncbi:LPS export ABC transporter permease LptF [Allofrancisella frigidaquae]|uniref:Lipopolysaccharide export system permease protein LptF n=1 Tax=Allofrancisella frigidaquae TaxID=1085644 RepID=A0A6M3HSM9_9GAMM|nr:LPS export ABC transporter permease LptF [Allofrancisella frigidaquae]QIV94264.1 LPS export ABC transporter permease LptF [Allofrancisella frigidaquae]
MILEKYYNRDIVNTFTSITLFIISIVSANLLIRLFQKAYSQGLGMDTIIKFVILTLPQNVTFVIPVAMFLAIILCFGKYFSNNEMFVTLAGGVTWLQIALNTLKPTIVLTIAAFFSSMYLIPLANQTTDVFQTSLSARALISSITDGKVLTIPNGRVLYINNKSGNKLNDLFLYQQTLRDKDYKIITAPQATVKTDKTAAFLNFTDVNIYTRELNSFKATYGTADKAIYTIYDNSIRDYNHYRMDRLYFGELVTNSLKGKNRFTAELFSRFNNCISIIIASLLALSLCRLYPRQNKYAKLLPSVIVLALYLCSVMFTNTLMAKGNIPAWVGIWLPHIFFAVFAIRTIKKQNGTSNKR